METSQNLLIKDILIEAIKMGASDIHFSVGNYPVLKISQELRYLENRGMINAAFMERLVEGLLSKDQQDQLKKEKEVVLAYNFDKNLRFKIYVFFQRGYISATLRYIPDKVMTLDELDPNHILKQVSKLKHGLIIIAGPFGSGRSSTAAALVEEINRTRKEYILTIENPIEYTFTNNKSIIEQREVGRDTNSFEDALLHFREEGGDVLFLEHISHLPTIPLVLEIASGDSLVITTMTTDTASKAIATLLDNFTSFDQERVRDLLAGSLKCVICQKIVPRIGGGLKNINELLLVNDTVRSIIASGNISQIDDIIQTSRKEGMISFNQSLLEAVRNREITAEDAMANAPDPKSLAALIS